MTGHYYNEFNPESAAMLRQMMNDGLLPKGDIDERSILDVRADDLRGYTQCHFFAGIGGWSYALQLAGWPDDRPVWTGSCPCQPFSSAGRQNGKADDRHLWPVWERLISECRPASVYGEQVESAIAHGWLDDVYQGLEAQGYAVGSAVLPACSVGAPHKRNRLWFVAHAELRRCERQPNQQPTGIQPTVDGASESRVTACTYSSSDDVAHSSGKGLQGHGGLINEHETQGREDQTGHSAPGSFWSGEWIDCPDGKQRLVKPGLPLLAHGVQRRRAILHAIGNAILPQVAAKFIGATM